MPAGGRSESAGVGTATRTVRKEMRVDRGLPNPAAHRVLLSYG